MILRDFKSTSDIVKKEDMSALLGCIYFSRFIETNLICVLYEGLEFSSFSVLIGQKDMEPNLHLLATLAPSN